MASSGAVVAGNCLRKAAVLALFWLALSQVALTGSAQTSGAKADPLILPLPVSMEFSQSLNPLAQNRLATDRFRFQAGTKSFKLQFSNQAPSFLGGKQFQGLPAGYRLTDFSLARKWGAIYGFRSLGYSSRLVQPQSARSFTGAAAELPKSFFGTRLSAYLLHAAPAGQNLSTKNNPLAASSGSQLGVTLARQLISGTLLQAEWAQTRHSSSSSGPASRAGMARHGLLIRLDGTLARNDLNVTFTTRDEGLANPANPVYGPGRRSFLLEMRRKVKQHQLHYSRQSDDQRALPLLCLVARNVQEDTLRWTYAPRRLPQVSTSQTWSRQTAATRREEEGTLRLSFNKAIRSITTSLAFLRGTRRDLQFSRHLWARTALTGDATIAIRKERRLHVRYERSGLLQHQPIQAISSTSLQFDTCVNLWEGKLSLAPLLDLRRQEGSSIAFHLSTVRVLLNTVIKLPHYVPGTDLFINFASSHASSVGRPNLNRTELTVRWNLKRM